MIGTLRKSRLLKKYVFVKSLELADRGNILEKSVRGLVAHGTCVYLSNKVIQESLSMLMTMLLPCRRR